MFQRNSVPVQCPAVWSQVCPTGVHEDGGSSGGSSSSGRDSSLPLSGRLAYSGSYRESVGPGGGEGVCPSSAAWVSVESEKMSAGAFLGQDFHWGPLSNRFEHGFLTGELGLGSEEIGKQGQFQSNGLSEMVVEVALWLRWCGGKGRQGLLGGSGV